jgi:glycosyltransferase involved in cell wall biosynthesis
MEQKDRLRLGIIFNFNPVWMGGIIYILNLIRTLNFLNDEEKPEIYLFYREDLKPFADRISYPHLHLIKWAFPPVAAGYLRSWLTRKNKFISEIIKKYELDGLYPLHDYPVKTRSKTRLVSWYADLQHEYYPEFFSWRKKIERTLRIKFILKNSDDLVVSSGAVADDFRRFFHIREKLRMHIFHFVSVIEDIDRLDIGEIREKYNLPEDYYMISNQFHKHKNHRVLLRSLALLKQEGKEIHMAMTGRFPDAHQSAYMRELHSIISENNLKPHISLLGVIPRNEQLLLMKHSRAVIQPSLFEGWSTVIEDAISLQVPVIASSLPVNIEQLGTDGCYFEPEDYKALAGILANFPVREPGKMLYQEYTERVNKAARTFVSIFES